MFHNNIFITEQKWSRIRIK